MPHLTRRVVLASVLLAAIGNPLAAQRPAAESRFEFSPGGTYDPAVPTPEAVLGYPVGTFHTDYARLEKWIAALQRSERVRVMRYGESIERRTLYLIVISSPQNLARLDEIKAGMRRLADPRTTTDTEADRLIRSLPAVAWMNHANDGNESAALEAAIQTSYQLAAGTDAVTRLILERLVTIVNPAHNPESHERFVAWYNSVQVGRLGTPDPQAAEHHAPWGMSTNNNHYQIDLNRDAFFVSQPETRAIVRAYAEWNPVVFVDHHGQTKNMFFPPPAEAVNLNVTQNQVDWMSRYGDAIGDAFDQHGWSYYRRGRFDLFYAGFWDSWPTLNGSIGLTFETDAGGIKGLGWEREDGTILRLREGVARHHIGAMATLRLTAGQKDRRLRDFYDFKRSAIAEGQRERMRQVVLFPGRDESRARELVRVLTDQQIEVYRTTAPVRLARAHNYIAGAGARTVPAGAYVIPMAQPQKRLAKAILEPEPAFKGEFLREQEQKKRRAELLGRWSRDGFYDVTAWSLPLLFGVDAVWAEDAPPVRGLERVGGDVRGLIAAQPGGPADGLLRPPPSALPPARYGYLFSSESFSSMRLVAQLLGQGFNLAVATQPFRVVGTDFPRGSILARVERNPAALHDRVAALAAENDVRVHALNSARVESGADFGEDPVVELKRPRIAVVTDEPTDERAYGATWFTLERRLGTGFTALKIEQLKTGDLGRYNVIVLPHGAPGDYHDLLGEQGIAKLRRWTQDGGTLVLMKGAAAFATRRGVEWTSARLKRHTLPVRLFFEAPLGEGAMEDPTRERRRAGRDTAGTAAAGRRDTTAAAPTREMDLVRTAGAILRVRIDPEHFLGFGYDGDVGATVSGTYAFTISRDAHNAAAFPDERSLRLAGHMWPEAQRTLARSLYAWVEPAGRGQVILFADDPNFRATQLSTMRLFFNAVVLGPSFGR
ncbi:MAG: hypothetical protein M3282_10405 [Gemmatimonadota bacterium]|nr:hypothetical protein [Gemmatimonadota bacterium]